MTQHRYQNGQLRGSAGSSSSKSTSYDGSVVPVVPFVRVETPVANLLSGCEATFDSLVLGSSSSSPNSLNTCIDMFSSLSNESPLSESEEEGDDLGFWYEDGDSSLSSEKESERTSFSFKEGS